MAHDTFVSYSSGDKPIADALVAALERAGIRCWVAPRDVMPGDKWADAIVRAIDGGKLMVLVFTSDANASQHIIREVELAAQHGMPVIPLRVEDVKPCPTLDYYIAGTHWLDAIDPPLEAHLERLTKVIGRLLEAPQAGMATQADPRPDLEGRTPTSPPSGATAVRATTGVLSPPVPPMPPPIPEMPGRVEAEAEVIPEMPGRVEAEAEVIPEMPKPPPSGPSRRRPRVMIVAAIVAAIALVAVGAVAVPRLVSSGGEGDEVSASETHAAETSATGETGETDATETSATGETGSEEPKVRAPRNLHTGLVGAHEVRVLWERAPHGARVDYFIVFRNDDRIAQVEERMYVDTAVSPSATYTYRVVAVGFDGRRASSKPLRVTTLPPATTAPPTTAPPTTAPPRTSPPPVDKDPPYDNKAECEAAGWVWLGDECVPYG